MSPLIDTILKQIEQLGVGERLLLHQRLVEIVDAEWRAAATEAQAIALEMGVDQCTIDWAIDDLRYGS